MQIDKLMIADGTQIYYSDTFRRVLEDHLTYLQTHPSTRQIAIDPEQAYRFEGDLWGLMSHYNVPMHLHYLVMRMNGLSSPQDSSVGITFLLVPNPNVVNQIRTSHMSSRRIS